MKIIRVFPRKTVATPDDENSRVGCLPGILDTADKIYISVAFSWDIPLAEKLYKEWKHVAPTEIGGPALNSPGGEFTPGMFLKKGYTITSRGCPNKCWFCSVWKRDSGIRELKINPGHIIQDDNLLACSESHIRKVFEMLQAQKNTIKFSGGIEAKLIKPWHIDLLSQIRLQELFCAYDTPDDLEPLIEAGKMLQEINVNFKNRKANCYVLIGHPKDTFEAAEKRIKETIQAGFFPFAMLWRNEKGEYKREWRQFQRQFSNKTITAVNSKKIIESNYQYSIIGKSYCKEIENQNKIFFK